MNYYWAAYRKGAFPDLSDDLTTDQFTAQVDSLARSKLVLTLIADHPIGMATVDAFHGFMWPDIIWFPWATPRQIVETSVYALQEGMRDATLMFIVDETRFASHMAKYGLLTRAGKLTDKRKIYERRKW